MSPVLIRYVLTAARRDKLFLSLLAIMVVGVFISLFMSTSAVIEKEHFSIVYLASSLRMLGLIGLILFVVFFIRRSFTDRDVEYLLTRPVSRQSFIISHAAAFSLLSLAISVLISLALTYFCFQIGHGKGALYWSAGLICEYILLVNVALFFSMVLVSPVGAALSTLGFYVLGRLMGQLLYIAKHPSIDVPGYDILSGAFQMISMLIPRLDLMTQTSWLLYGPQSAGDFLFIIAQSVIFLFLILLAALIDLRRRQF